MQQSIEMVTRKELMNLFPSFASLYIIGEDHHHSFSQWTFQTTTILDNGNCCKCGESMKLFPLTIADKHGLANELERIIEERTVLPIIQI